MREGLGFFVSGYRIGTTINEASLRKAGFEAIKNDLRGMGMPYFIPLAKDNNLSILPGLTVLAPSPAARMAGAAPAPPRRSRPCAGRPRNDKGFQRHIRRCHR